MASQDFFEDANSQYSFADDDDDGMMIPGALLPSRGGGRGGASSARGRGRGRGSAAAAAAAAAAPSSRASAAAAAAAAAATSTKATTRGGASAFIEDDEDDGDAYTRGKVPLTSSAFRSQPITQQFTQENDMNSQLDGSVVLLFVALLATRFRHA